jgi:hypothetical protein
MPDVDAHDEPQVLPAFLKLLALFRLFEESKMFDIIEDSHLGTNQAVRSARVTQPSAYDILQDRFRDGASGLDQICDVQRADLCVTRHWMRMLTWKALCGQRIQGSPSSQLSISPTFPLLVARDLVDAISRLPRTALQAHGFGMVRLLPFDCSPNTKNSYTATETARNCQLFSGCDHQHINVP